MPTPRWAISCAVVKNIKTGAAEVVVTGGHNSIKGTVTYYDAVEIYNVETNSWRKAGRVLVQVIFAYFVTYYTLNFLRRHAERYVGN
jgi:hypothetical protein